MKSVWGMLAIAIVLEVSAALSLKGAIEMPALYLVVVAGYVGSFWLLAGILRRGMGLGVVYGIWGAMGVASTAVLSWLLFDEPMTPSIVLGLVLVVAGVVTVELGSQAAHRRREESA